MASRSGSLGFSSLLAHSSSMGFSALVVHSSTLDSSCVLVRSFLLDSLRLTARLLFLDSSLWIARSHPLGFSFYVARFTSLGFSCEATTNLISPYLSTISHGVIMVECPRNSTAYGWRRGKSFASRHTAHRRSKKSLIIRRIHI